MIKILFLVPALVLAQGSGSIATPPSVSGSDSAPFRVTRSVTGAIRKISAQAMTIEDGKTKKLVELLIPEKSVRVSGAVKTIGAIVEGASVRINYAADGLRILDIRVLTNSKAENK